MAGNMETVRSLITIWKGSAETSQISIRGALGGVMSATLALGGLFDNGLGALIHWFPLTCILGTFPSKFNFGSGSRNLPHQNQNTAQISRNYSPT